jgi:hypothetical protein
MNATERFLCRFQPLSFSWVALHPQPKGVIVFIGGAFFGTFPTLFYRYFLQQLFNEGYTIVALPFRFSFRHWSIALELLKEELSIRNLLVALDSKARKIPESLYADPTKYTWIGHSLGCKYLCLLEILTGAILNQDQSGKNLQKCIQFNSSGLQRVLKKLETMNASIQDQSTILIAPDISDTQSAIPKPLAFIARWLDRLGWGVLPTRKETQCLIDTSSLFNLIALISFNRDTIAGSQTDTNIEESDVRWFVQQLKKRSHLLLAKELCGKHLEPVGVKIGTYLVDLNPLDKFIKPLSKHPLPSVVHEFLVALQGDRSKE